MEKDLEQLHEIDFILAKLVDGDDLTAKDTEQLTHTIFTHDTDGIHFATFIGAIHAKGETAEELFGFLNAIKRLATTFDAKIDLNKVTDLSGTGGGAFKTINASTAASFVVAVAGYTVAKEAYFAVTSPTGSADIFTAFGIDFFKLTKKQIEEALKEEGVCPIIVPFISPNMENYSALSKKTFVDRQLRVRSPFHLASNIYSPMPMNHRIYGCYSERYLEIIANLFMSLEYKRSLTFYADIGMPEVSNVGKTTIVEQNGTEIKKYTVEPRDLGVAEATEDEIRTGGREQNIIDFIDILKGKQNGAKADLVAINAGVALYALEDVETIIDGVKKAQEILKSGKAYDKFEQLINKIGSPELLEKYK